MTRVAFLKFDLSDFASVEWAVLRLYAGFSDQLENRVIAIYDVTGADWSESDLTWENAPLTEGKMISSRSVSNESGVWYEFTITRIVQEHIEQGVEEITIRVESKPVIGVDW